jgi:hypothetical protein
MVDESAVLDRSTGHSELRDLAWYSSNKNFKHWTHCFLDVATRLKDKPNKLMLSYVLYSQTYCGCG